MDFLIAELPRQFGEAPGESGFSVFYSLQILAGLVMGAGLFMLAGPFVRRLMPSGNLPVLSAETERRWLYSGTALIGLYYLVQYLPVLLGAAVVQAQMVRNFIWQQDPLGLAVAAAVILGAFAMIFRVRHLLAWRALVNEAVFRNITPGGREEEQAADSEPPGSA